MHVYSDISRYLPQQHMEQTTLKVRVGLNLSGYINAIKISKAIAPIQNIEAKAKYWISKDITVQKVSC